MKCPICNKELVIDFVVYRNLETYGGTRLIVTACCEMPVYVSPVISYRAEEYTGSRKEDDWGNKIKQ